MAIVKTDDKYYASIAAKIREKTGEDTTYKPSEMADGIDAVFIVGQDDGYALGYTDGEAVGIQSEYDCFWDGVQKKGGKTPVLYYFDFSGFSWNNTTFKPKYDIIGSSTLDYIFANSKITDIKGVLEERGLKFDVSDGTSFYFAFYGAQTTRLPEIDTSNAQNLQYCCYYCPNLVSIDKFIFKSDGSQTIDYCFRSCSSLESVVFEGVIGKSLSMPSSTKLTHDTIVSLINALSSTTSSITLTLSKIAIDNAFATSEGAADGTGSEEWADLIATKSNWTISLV